MTVEEEVVKLQTSLPRSIRRNPEAESPWDQTVISLSILIVSILGIIKIGPLSEGETLVSLLWMALLAFLFFSTIVSAFLLLGGLSWVVELRRDKFLVRYGNAALAEITSNESQAVPNDFGESVIIRYKFFTHDQVEIEGRWDGAEPAWWRYKAGRKFVMFYDPEHPLNHIAYRDAMYRVL
jgi:hypothetical protein